ISRARARQSRSPARPPRRTPAAEPTPHAYQRLIAFVSIRRAAAARPKMLLTIPATIRASRAILPEDAALSEIPPMPTILRLCRGGRFAITNTLPTVFDRLPMSFSRRLLLGLPLAIPAGRLSA